MRAILRRHGPIAAAGILALCLVPVACGAGAAGGAWVGVGSAGGNRGNGGNGGTTGGPGDTGAGGGGGGIETVIGGPAGRASRGGAGGTDSDAGLPGTVDGGAPRFSFFVTSLGAMQALSGSPDGFGGDLRFGQTGAGAGLRGADEICRAIAERSMPGAGAKGWRAFLSATTGGPNGGPVNAIERVGLGPWYDRLGRVVAFGTMDLAHDRPAFADPAIVDDLPNESGIPNHLDGAPGCTGGTCPDNHDVLTGTGADGNLYAPDPQLTCGDWTSAAPSGRPWCGHSWPRIGSGTGWMSAINEGGCAPGVNLYDTGPATPGVLTVGAGGGYGALYCFALAP